MGLRGQTVGAERAAPIVIVADFVDSDEIEVVVGGVVDGGGGGKELMTEWVWRWEGQTIMPPFPC